MPFAILYLTPPVQQILTLYLTSWIFSWTIPQTTTLLSLCSLDVAFVFSRCVETEKNVYTYVAILS